jgi:hypothetical protein
MIPDDFFFLVDRREISEEGQDLSRPGVDNLDFSGRIVPLSSLKGIGFLPACRAQFAGCMNPRITYIERITHENLARKPVAFRNDCTTCTDGSVVTANAEGLSRLAKYQRSTCTSSRGCTGRLSLRRLYQDHIPVIEPRDLLVVSSNRSKGAL